MNFINVQPICNYLVARQTKLLLIRQEIIQQLRAERDTLATKIELEEHRRRVQETMATNDGQVDLIEERVTQLEQEDRYSRGGHMSGTMFHCLILLHVNILLLHL